MRDFSPAFSPLTWAATSSPELSASQEMVRYAGLVIAATLGCTITFTIPVGMGMLKSGDRLFFSAAC